MTLKIRICNLRGLLLIKFIYSEKATQFCELFSLLLTKVHTVKSKVKILHNFVAFSEYMIFNKLIFFLRKVLKGGLFRGVSRVWKLKVNSRDLKPQDPHDSRQLKDMNWGFASQYPNLDQRGQFSYSSIQPWKRISLLAKLNQIIREHP